MALFDRYLIVDWSAANKPRLGADSIWLALFDGTTQTALENIATRVEAMAFVRAVIGETLDQAKRILVGFDFAFGYPVGAAEHITGRGTWEALWARMSDWIEDGPTNESNAFKVAARVNRVDFASVSGPFWGHPHQHAGRYQGLEPTKNRAAFNSIPEFRAVERIAKGAKSVWQLSYNGAVGKQAMLGMAHLDRLRRDPSFADHVAVWPFETQFAKDLSKPVVIAEIYPSLFPVERGSHIAKDAAQVTAVAGIFAHLDGENRLSSLLDAPMLAAVNRDAVEREEGWIVGAGHEVDLHSALPNPAETGTFNYIRDPAAIYRESFAIIEREAALDRFGADERVVAIRMIHACGMTDLADDIVISQGAAEAGRAALAAGASVVCDVEMVRRGIIRNRLPKDNPVLCEVSGALARQSAAALGTTISAGGIETLEKDLAGGVVVIGNAPTALFHLLEMLERGATPPALIIGCPVGFVGAMESKEALIVHRQQVPFITVRGRRGGSAIAAAALNALSGGLEA